MEIKSNKFIILRLPSDEENISFIYQTFGITHYIFFDDRFRSSLLINENEIEYYQQFREKCLKIKDTQVAFTINEFLFLAKTVDFVAKCLIGEPKDKLEKILTSDFEDEDYDFHQNKKWYLRKSTNLIQGFRDSCKNEKLLKQLSEELDWKIDV